MTSHTGDSGYRPDSKSTPKRDEDDYTTIGTGSKKKYDHAARPKGMCFSYSKKELGST